MRKFTASRVRSFGHAFDGWWYVLRTQRNAWLHGIVALAVFGLSFWLRLDPLRWALIVLTFTGWRGTAAAATVLLLGAVSAFLALNFTGSTPFTSLSGVRKEMRLSMPVMACASLAGLALCAAALLR